MMLPSRCIAGGQMIAIIWLNAIEASRHARGFSLKVPAKPVMKTGAGVAGLAVQAQASAGQGQG
ncbi:hypothetical protein CQ14_04240 [Bradyrhizobium lablabi]|uniref:Uncharacterized protein n=2 Tax=Bradyrhizobium lablabi TaxID=722472 RepID=A0A0R3M6H9_9BRAD|nr:hypothetical protein CQ14_04240 [Bradyrhizobium lablabi]